jgi:hypothetical protein
MKATGNTKNSSEDTNKEKGKVCFIIYELGRNRSSALPEEMKEKL